MRKLDLIIGYLVVALLFFLAALAAYLYLRLA